MTLSWWRGRGRRDVAGAVAGNGVEYIDSLIRARIKGRPVGHVEAATDQSLACRGETVAASSGGHSETAHTTGEWWDVGEREEATIRSQAAWPSGDNETTVTWFCARGVGVGEIPCRMVVGDTEERYKNARD